MRFRLAAEHHSKTLHAHNQAGIKQVKTNGLFQSPFFFEIEQVIEHIWHSAIEFTQSNTRAAGAKSRFSAIFK